MSGGLELIVRPFQTPDITPPQIIHPGAATAISPNVRLRFGEHGSTKLFHGSYSLSETFYVKKWPKETVTT